MSSNDVGQIGAGKKQVGVVLDSALFAQIADRAHALSMTPSRYAAEIIAQWDAKGAPGINEADRALLTMRAAKRSKAA